MLRRQALIRKLPAVETLGVGHGDLLRQDRDAHTEPDDRDRAAMSRDTRCVSTPAPSRLSMLHRRRSRSRWWPGRSATTVRRTWTTRGSGSWLGDPTETALLQAAADAGLDVHGLRARIPRVGEQPFDSTRKRMSTVHDPLHGSIPELVDLPQDVRLAFVKGAVDGLLQHTTAVWDDGVAVPFDDEWHARISAGNDAARLHQVCVYWAWRSGRCRTTATTPESELPSSSGSSGSSIRPAPRFATLYAVCRSAGIRPLMITGDHPQTAAVYCRRVGHHSPTCLRRHRH